MSDEQKRRGSVATKIAQWIFSAAIGASITYIGRSYMGHMRILGPPDRDPMGWLIFLYFPGLLLGAMIGGMIGRLTRLLGWTVYPRFLGDNLFLFGNVMNFVFYTLMVYLVIRWCRRRVS